MHVKRHPWSSDLHTKGKDLPDPGLRVATFANRWRYTEEGEVRDERPEPSAVAAMAMLPQKTQSPGQATVARHQWAEHRLVDVAGSSRETHLASQCSHAATAAQSAKVHPANGTRTGSAQPRPPERPPPAHDRIPTGRGAQPPFWRELRLLGHSQQALAESQAQVASLKRQVQLAEAAAEHEKGNAR